MSLNKCMIVLLTALLSLTVSQSSATLTDNPQQCGICQDIHPVFPYFDMTIIMPPYRENVIEGRSEISGTACNKTITCYDSYNMTDSFVELTIYFFKAGDRTGVHGYFGTVIKEEIFCKNGEWYLSSIPDGKPIRNVYTCHSGFFKFPGYTSTTRTPPTTSNGCNESGFQLLSKKADTSLSNFGKFAGNFTNPRTCDDFCKQLSGLVICTGYTGYMYEQDKNGRCTIFHHSLDDTIIHNPWINQDSNALLYKRC